MSVGKEPASSSLKAIIRDALSPYEIHVEDKDDAVLDLVAHEASALIVAAIAARYVPSDAVVDIAGRHIGKEVYGFGSALKVREYTSPEFQEQHRQLAKVGFTASIQQACREER